ncbi:potassium-transporting ATPase subunit KdpC [Marinospirillum sp.]|uniref:potassium-transporting ATPase subunit KdpC n=1 Tax=Marinospirillum sp. TaxID=2183934 RepID=UPI003A89E923
MNSHLSSSTSLTQQALMSLRTALVMVLLLGGLYTAVATQVGGWLFPEQAQGSLILQDGHVIGSALVAQPFQAEHYFSSRPSAADYNPFDVGGSNLAPSNPELAELASARWAALSVSNQVVPADLLTASGSGIDPHLSPEALILQAPRVAAARNLDLEHLIELIHTHQEAPTWGVLGQARVNVLRLNLALDQLVAQERE